MRCSPCLRRRASGPLIQLQNASFYRVPPSSDHATALFPDTSLHFPSKSKSIAAWAIVGGNAAVRTDFLKALRGDFICDPPIARTYPFLTTREILAKNPWLQSPHNAIQYVGFDAERGNSNLRGSYLSQRYESKRQIDDYAVRDFLSGKTALNADENLLQMPSNESFERIVTDLKLEKLLDMPVSNLSNGQSRRTRIAKALLLDPEVLILDSPFMGLDVHAVLNLADVLRKYAKDAAPRLIMSLKSEEHTPDWISHFIMLQDDWTIQHQGTSAEMTEYAQNIVKESADATNVAAAIVTSSEQWRNQMLGTTEVRDDSTRSIEEQSKLLEGSKKLLRNLKSHDRKEKIKESNRVYRLMDLRHRRPQKMHASKDGFRALDTTVNTVGEPLIEMSGVQVTYGQKTVLGHWSSPDASQQSGLSWSVHRGQRWGVFGPNGSGKTTLTALITSDHPQSYSLPIKFFGRARLPEPGKPGISFFDLQEKIGFSSPELHAFFPKHISIRHALESAWAETPLSKAQLTPDLDDRIDAILLWFRSELCPELGMTDLQRNELYRPRNTDTLLFKGSKNKPWVRARHDAHVKERITTNQSLGWADENTFGSLPFASQRVLLFLRAIIKKPDIVILDEPFSGMDPFTIQKCQSFLAYGDRKTIRLFHSSHVGFSAPSLTRSELDIFDLSLIDGLTDQQALVFIAHRKEEVPGSVRNWLCLPEPGEGVPRSGLWDGPLECDPNKWREVWDLPLITFNRIPFSERKPLPPNKRGPDYVGKVPRRLRDLPRAQEVKARKMILIKRRWWGRNLLRSREERSMQKIRAISTELRRVRFTIMIRQSSFQQKRPVERLLVRAELCLHDAVVEAQKALKSFHNQRAFRYYRRVLRRRGTYKVPHNTTYLDKPPTSMLELVDIHHLTKI